MFGSKKKEKGEEGELEEEKRNEKEENKESKKQEFNDDIDEAANLALAMDSQNTTATQYMIKISCE